jgi:2-methylcitrate dehydratase PrpD
MEEKVTQTLARYLVKARHEDLPQDVRHEAARALLNWMGCAIGSTHHETVSCALSAIKPFAGPAQATIFGQSERVDILHAALLNGISSHVLDYDDTHARTVHVSAPVYPAILAYCEWQRLSGRDLVHAFALGVETECRVGLSVFPEHYDAGWHITGTAGTFGAAAAAGKLMNLNEQQMTWALGIAATQASGLREMFGSMCKSLHPGGAAQKGMQAALLAAKNFTSSECGIEAPAGFAQVLSSKFDPSVITDGLGAHYELPHNMYKPFACGLWMHATIDGCIHMKREHGLAPADIARVDIRVGPMALELTGKPKPTTGLEGKFSLYHAASAAFIYAAGGEAQFADEVVNHPEVVALRNKVVTHADTGIGKFQSDITVTLADGRTLHYKVEHALGTVERPMSDTDLEEKFRGLVEPVLGAKQASDIIAKCWSVETLPDAGALARASVPAT